jgi:hypothetical protein
VTLEAGGLLRGSMSEQAAFPWRRVALYALLLNGVWEFVQCTFLYDMWGMSFWRATLWMWAAIFGDVLIVLGVTALTRRLSGFHHRRQVECRNWIGLLVISALAAVLLEWAARALGLWNYTPLMPTVRILGERVGLVPIAQITLLPALSVRLSFR